MGNLRGECSAQRELMRRHTLLIDADDTLWENNVFFEKLIEDFISLVEPCGYTRSYIRHVLNETERKNIRQYGYGARSFGRSLEETYIKLAEQMAKRETLALIHGRVIELERTPPKILDGVPETLAYLTERHRLILFTKGEPAEQAAKVERSGLQGFFEFIEIVPEKDPTTYGGLVHKHKIVKSQGWMIGNSPRSDINPAMKIGLNAVYIPHPHTWQLEHEPVMAGSGKLVILPAFRELRGHF
jgi:putative hydrolase of the HAD superfamily